MTRDVVLGVSCLSLALLACGGGKDANTPGNGDWALILERQDMGEKAFNIQTGFAALSRKHGCDVNEKSEGVGAVCNEGAIVLLREGTQITVGCKNMSKAACEQLFKAIAAEGKE